jgi:hypothetical protein
MKRWTVDEIMAWKQPYYSRETVEELIGDGLTAIEIADLDIPASDLLWVLLRKEIIPVKELRLLACDFAQDAVDRYLTGKPEPQAVIDTARRFALGEATRKELTAVWTLAWDAAWNASSEIGVSSAWEAAAEAAYNVWNPAAAAKNAALAARSVMPSIDTHQLAMTRAVLVAISEGASHDA